MPRVSCLTRNPVTCEVCASSVKPGSKNRRRNTSLLIRYAQPGGGKKNIVIDVGKFFWHSAIEWFPRYQVPGIDAIVITHAHADAIGGMDDLRDWTNNVQEAIPIYLRQRDLDVIAKTHFYLVDASLQTGGGGIAKLRFDLIDEEPFEVHGLKLTPLPVEHGERMIALGYRFGDFSYVSDASHIPDSTAKLIEGSDILVMDALRATPHRSHFNIEQAIEQIRRFRPRKAYLVDMTHDSDHEKTNAELAKLKTSEGLDIELAYDGLKLETLL
ncbi:MAG: MBL fold metallo-hydrolase [Chloroflexi bacterium]|nr:MBL fold metallo-hydrolase [Chloroflexota bacterium]